MASLPHHTAAPPAPDASPHDTAAPRTPTGGARRWPALRAAGLVAAIAAAILVARLSAADGPTATATPSTTADAAQGAPPTPATAAALQVRTATVTAAAPQVLRLHGHITSADVRTLSFEVGGPVREVTVERGDRVSRGDAIARLDVGALRHQQRAARARSEDLAAQQHRVRQDLERAQRLLSQGAATASQVDALEASAAQLEAAQRGVAAELDELTRLQRDAVLRAPEDGEVLQVHLRAGGVAGPGQPVLTLRTAGQLEAEVAVPESWLMWIREDQPAEVHFPVAGLAPQAGRVEALLEPPGGVGLTRARLALGEQAGLRPGMRVVVEVVAPAAGWEVPLAALTRTPATAVWRVSGDAVAPVAVRLVEVRGSTAVVAGALAAGDAVAVTRLDRLEAGQAVAVMGGRP